MALLAILVILGAVSWLIVWAVAGVVGLVAGSDTYPGAGLLATRGAVRVSDPAGADGAVELRPGDAVYVGGGAQRARFEGRGEAFVAQPGRR